MIVLLFLLHAVHAVPLDYLYNRCEFLDLSYEFNDKTIYWPTFDPFKLEVIFKGIDPEGGYYYTANKFAAPEHGGTHLDAPSHFNQDGATVERIPVKTFIGEAHVINVTDKVKANRDYTVTVDDIQDYVKKYGKIEDHAIVIIYTGYGAYWPNKKEYLGSDVPHDDKDLHFPGVSKEAATWLSNNTKIGVLGIDTASMDAGPSRDFPVHRILTTTNVSFFENLRNVDKLPPRGATIIALPMMITGGSGGPLRAVAVGWNGQNDPCRVNVASSGCRSSRGWGISLVILLVVFFV